jgi:hypothetical protein
MARIKTILRRVRPEAVAETLTYGDILLDRAKKRVTRGARDINPSPTEFRLLGYFMQAPEGPTPAPSSSTGCGATTLMSTSARWTFMSADCAGIFRAAVNPIPSGRCAAPDMLSMSG